MLYIFGIAGGGWRSEFFLRTAGELPGYFRVSFVIEPDEKRAAYLKEKWGVRIIGDLEAVDEKPDFLVLTLPPSILPEFIVKAVKGGHYVLSETFVPADVSIISDLYNNIPDKRKVQFSEQYWLQPVHAARLAVIKSGLIGTVSQAQVSAGHGYHGISLLRKYLDAGFQNCQIRGKVFANPIVRGPGRQGVPEKREIIEDCQELAVFDFGGKWGLFDFTEEQYFSAIRGPRVLIRGEQGEIAGHEVRYLQDYRTPLTFTLRRDASGVDGSMGPPHILGYSGGERWYYQNPFGPCSLSDDELALAAVLEGMGSYVKGGKAIYPLEEALQDQYLTVLMKQAFNSGNAIESSTQVWAR
ncbi:MAG: hypothetical protein LBK08_10995 [Treponema sp.]|jgi:hypothetical protein|nr:hypothetical protein [Treponema sp.]